MLLYRVVPAALAPLALVASLAPALVASLCLPAPSLALRALSALATQFWLRGEGAEPVSRTAPSHAPLAVVARSP